MTTVVDKVGMRTNKDGEQVEVKIEDLKLAVQQSAGDEIDKDCSCDLAFMLEKVPRIGAALRASFHLAWRASDNLLVYGQCRRAWDKSSNFRIHGYTLGTI